MQETVTTFLGWATLVHTLLLCLCAFFVVVLRDWAVGIHQAMFKVETSELRLLYITWIAYYEILVITFFAVPWAVLWLVM